MHDVLKNDYLLDQGFTCIQSSDEWLEYYPPTKHGEYRPQPTDEPEHFPCWFREIMVTYNPHGADIAVVCILY